MKRSRSKQPPSHVQIGIFVLACALIALASLYMLSILTPGHGSYRIGVRFERAAGISQEARVFLNGVEVGTVEKIRLLPDNSLEVILAIKNNTDIAKTSTFTIHPSFVGSSTIIITQPISGAQLARRPTPLPSEAVLEKRILPVDQQPVGVSPLGLEDLLAGNQQLAHRATAITSSAYAHKDKIFQALRQSRANALATSVQLHATTKALAPLQLTVISLRKTLSAEQDALRNRNKQKIAMLASALQSSASSLDSSMDSLHATMALPGVKANMQASVRQVRAITSNALALTRGVRNQSADRQARSELADAAAHLKAALQKIGLLLRSP